MCSSALVAIHEACEYLRGGKGDLAIAGGVNLYLHPSAYIELSMGHLLSKTSKCGAFGNGGSGFVPGEGVGVIILKRYGQALEDRDSIYALIRGSAVNHNGKTNGYTTPNPNQQALVIQQALEQSGIDSRTISYVEAAATGSEMGDAIEMTALTKVFATREGAQGPYRIGSVKPNIGHCESASGMSQITKVILSLRYQTLPPTLVEGPLNTEINFDQLPFELQRDLDEWKPVTIDGIKAPRRAGVMGVGVGGVNAHLIIEEYVERENIKAPEAVAEAVPLSGNKSQNIEEVKGPYLIVLSAKSQNRLEDYVRQWIVYLTQNPGVDIERIAYTLQVGRVSMSCRLALVVTGQEELVNQLGRWTDRTKDTGACSFGDVDTKRLIASEEVTQAVKTGRLQEIAKMWIRGNTIPWNELHQDKKLFRATQLPTYPFERRKCWIHYRQNGHTKPEGNRKDRDHQKVENKAVEFYSLGAKKGTKTFKEEYLTFCPFEEKIPGFSMSRMFLNSEKFPAEMALVKDKQIEMRQVLFCKEDFKQINSVLDIGCGHGTDVIQIASLYPHIKAHGFTLTQDQADLGNQRIHEMALADRAKIVHADSSKDTFLSSYDLMIGIEVTFHIRNKRGLFRNMESSLHKNGRVLLMDYTANLRGPVVDPSVEISIPTRQDWIELLSGSNFLVDEIIDVSPQIANFLFDPEVEQNIRDLPEVAQNTLRNYAHQSMSLEKGWISYCLFKLKRGDAFSMAERRDHNAYKITRPITYPAALKEMRGHATPLLYPKSKREFGRVSPLSKKNVADTGCQFLPSATPVSQIDQDQMVLKKPLQEVFVELLGLQRQDLAEATFEELGIGSINAVQLVEAINVQFNLNLPTSVVFEFPTLDALAAYIKKELSTRQPSPHRVDLSVSHPLGTKGPGEKSYMDQKGEENVCDQAIHYPSLIQPHDQKASGIIAIIGLSCRCAGANGPDEFWTLVSQEKNAIGNIENKEWLDFFKRHSSTRVPCRYGAMEGFDYFDTQFFHISPKEAELMDPGQRVLLEESYKALEDAGYPKSRLQDQLVGTFIGTMGSAPLEGDFSHLSMLGSDTSILSARIAYYLDLKGPALAVNTACSSSLVAIDLACQGLKDRSIDFAVAGGITIYTHPGAFLSMNNAGMLSPTGRCRPFDNAADGIVVGDGVGIVILKRLEEAEQDHDQIYGVIRGSGTNQDGQTSGITVPSFLSQCKLQESVYKKNSICVEDIQYIEAHGTATKLGDPIEIHALTESFEQFTKKKRFCAIGSLKANIGHTGAAAGVLALIKVLLSLKYKQMAPSINFEKPNDHIAFESSPVFINRSLRDWRTNSKGSRLAAISSFGFSGTNAHMVVEEYSDEGSGNVDGHSVSCDRFGSPVSPNARLRVQDSRNVSEGSPAVRDSELRIKGPCLVVLSAKNEARLQEMAKNLCTYLTINPSRWKPVNLRDLAYTLQIGREAMEERLAIIVRSLQELEEKLEGFVEGQKDIEDLYRGQVKRNDDTLAVFAADEELQEAIEKWIQRGKYSKLLDLWVKGLVLDWSALYEELKPHRISVPTYPFSKERYWISSYANQTPNHKSQIINLKSPLLHPLVHENTSNFEEQRFSSTFTGEEFFLADHVMKGQKILPGVVYLEMAREAIQQSVGTLTEDQLRIQLKQVVWAQSMVANGRAQAVHIGLYPEENGQIQYEIYTEPKNSDEESEKVPGRSQGIVHSQGVAALSAFDERPPADLSCLLETISQRQLSSKQCYTTLKRMGIDYGSGHQGLELAYVGNNQVLAKLSLPSSILESQNQFILHPSLLDSALQASIGLFLKSKMDFSSAYSLQPTAFPSLPFALETLDIVGECTANMWGWIRYVSTSEHGDKIQKLDIELYNDQGIVCAQMKGFSSRVLDTEVRPVESVGTLMCQPIWKEEAISKIPNHCDYSLHYVMYFKQDRLDFKTCGLADSSHEFKWVELYSNGKDISDRYEDISIQVFEIIRGILDKKPKGKILIQILVPLHGKKQLFTGLSRIAKNRSPGKSKLIGASHRTGSK